MEYTTETVVPDSMAENSHTLLASASDAPDSVMPSSDYVASSESVDIASEGTDSVRLASSQSAEAATSTSNSAAESIDSVMVDSDSMASSSSTLEYTGAVSSSTVVDTATSSSANTINSAAATASETIDASSQSDSIATSIQDAASDVTNSLSSQLSDVTYDGSFEQADSASKQFALPTGSFVDLLSTAKEASASKLGNLFGSVSHSLEALPGKVAGAGTSSAKAMGKAISEFDVTKMEIPTMPRFEAPSEPISLDIVEGSNAVMSSVADASLSDIGNAAFSGIKFVGGIIVQFLDFIVGAVAGTSLAQVFGNLQTSVQSVIDNASHTVVNTINNLGNITLKEVLQSLVTLIITIADALLKVMNSLVYLISGADVSDWALQTTNTISEASAQLVSQVGATYHDVTHKSLSELASSIGDYSHHVGYELYSVMASLSHEAVGFGDSLSDSADVSYLSESFDSIATAVQTAFTL